MSGDAMWDGFAGAIVRLELPAGPVLLEPREPGSTGVFPFAGPVHIITAHNPAGLETDDEANGRRHGLLGQAVSGLASFPTIGSAPDGSMPEPGYGVLGISLGEALDLARRFGQRAIYEWTSEALNIVGVDELRVSQLGWSLSDCR